MKTTAGMIGNHPRPIGAVLGAVLAWLLNVFTVHGLLVALGLEAGDDLASPWATRIVWWLLFYAAGSAWVSRLMWRDAKLTFTNPAQLWAASHVEVVKRLARRARWWHAGVSVVVESRRRHRRVTVPERVPTTTRTVPETVPETASASGRAAAA